jgi:hypothetical protein
VLSLLQQARHLHKDLSARPSDEDSSHDNEPGAHVHHHHLQGPLSAARKTILPSTEQDKDKGGHMVSAPVIQLPTCPPHLISLPLGSEPESDSSTLQGHREPVKPAKPLPPRNHSYSALKALGELQADSGDDL